MKSLIASIASTPGVPYGTPVKEMLMMFLDGRLQVRDIASGEVLDPMKYEWARMIDGKHYNEYPVYQVICKNGRLERSYLPYDTLCSRQ